jgi:hypothetical protein
MNARAASAEQDDDSALDQPIGVPPIADGDGGGPAGVHWDTSGADANPTPSPAGPSAGGSLGGGGGGSGGSGGGSQPPAAVVPDSSGGAGGDPGTPTGNSAPQAEPAQAQGGLLPSGNTPFPSGFGAPIKRFTGRYVDSVSVPDYQCGFRTAHSSAIRVSADKKRIYFQMGSGVVAYDAVSFLTQKLGQPLVPITNLRGALGINYSVRFCGKWIENYLPWDKFSYFESPLSGFRYLDSRMDGQERLLGYDIDDRGNIYSATMVYGWGIAHDDGGADGALMTFVSQVDAYNPEIKDLLSVTSIFAVKANPHYYALVGGQLQRQTGVWEVTNAAKPVFLGIKDIPLPARITQNKPGDRLAMVQYAGGEGSMELRIYTADGYVNGEKPIFRAAPEAGRTFGFGVATDGVNFYAAETGPNLPLRFHILTPKGLTYVDFPVQTAEVFNVGYLDYGSGFLSASEYYGRGVRLFRVASPTSIQNAGGDVLKDYYASKRPEKVSIVEALPYALPDGKPYLIVSAYALGDVYQLNASTGAPDASVPPAPASPASPAPPPPVTPVATKPPSPAAPSCSAVPTNENVSMYYAGATSKCARFSACAPEEPIGFHVSGGLVGYPFDEACDTYSWDWGEGSGPVFAGRNPVHVFAGGKSSYNVTMTIRTGNSSLTQRTIVMFSPGGGVPSAAASANSNATSGHNARASGTSKTHTEAGGVPGSAQGGGATSMEGSAAGLRRRGAPADSPESASGPDAPRPDRDTSAYGGAWGARTRVPAKPATLQHADVAGGGLGAASQQLLGRITQLTNELNSGTLTSDEAAVKAAQLKKASSDFSLSQLRGDQPASGGDALSEEGRATAPKP